MRAPAWLASQRCAKSAARPSEMSIAARTPPVAWSARANFTRESGATTRSTIAAGTGARDGGLPHSASAVNAAALPGKPVTATTSPGFAPARVHAAPGSTSPSSASVAESGPSAVARLPPTIAAPSAASTRAHARSSSRHSACDQAAGTTSESSAQRGSAAIAARSERFATASRAPASAGVRRSRRKCRPSTNASVVATRSRPSRTRSTAASSPGPTTTPSPAGSAASSAAMRSNSPPSGMALDSTLARRQQHHERDRRGERQQAPERERRLRAHALPQRAGREARGQEPEAHRRVVDAVRGGAALARHHVGDQAPRLALEDSAVRGEHQERREHTDARGRERRDAVGEGVEQVADQQQRPAADLVGEPAERQREQGIDHIVGEVHERHAAGAPAHLLRAQQQERVARVAELEQEIGADEAAELRAQRR